MRADAVSRDIDRSFPNGPHTHLYVLPWELSSPGGVSQVVQNLFDEDKKQRGNSPLLLVKSWGLRSPVFDEVEGRATVRAQLRSPSDPKRPFRALASFALCLPFDLLRVLRLLAHKEVVAIYVHYPDLDALIWTLVRPLLRRTLTVTLSFHGSDFKQAATARGLSRWLWQRLLGTVDAITVCSGDLRADLASAFHIPLDKIREVVNGVNPESLRQLAISCNELPLPCQYIVSLATIEHKKGLDVLIDSFNRIASDFPELSLVLAGRVAEPAFLDLLRQLQEQSPASARIHILTNLPHRQAIQALSSARLFVLPSRQEPFGIAVLEAAVFSIPVIATTVCGVVKAVHADRALTSVPPDNTVMLAQAIASTLNDWEQAQAMGQRLTQRVLRDFTWERIAKSYKTPCCCAETDAPYERKSVDQ